MSRILPTRATRLVAYAAAMVIVGWTADRAEATCGGYVHVRGQKLHVEQPSMKHDSVEGAQGSATDDHGGRLAGRNADSPERTPCNGPTCSKGSFPPAAPVPSEPVSTEQWACSFPYGLVSGNSSASLLPASDAELSDGVGLSIIRPPR